MKKIYLAISLIALSIASSSIPADAQSFWHQLKDQAFNTHGGQYGYPSTYSSVYGNGYNSSGIYGNQQGWGQQPLRVRTYSFYGNGHNNSLEIYGNQQGWGQQPLQQQQLQQHQLQEHQQLEREQYFGY